MMTTCGHVHGFGVAPIECVGDGDTGTSEGIDVGVLVGVRDCDANTDGVDEGVADTDTDSEGEGSGDKNSGDTTGDGSSWRATNGIKLSSLLLVLSSEERFREKVGESSRAMSKFDVRA